jgi:hypothetical protein
MTSIPSQLGQCKGSKIMTMSDSIRLNLYLNRFLDQKQHVQNITGKCLLSLTTALIMAKIAASGLVFSGLG